MSEADGASDRRRVDALERRLAAIEARNRRAERDKAWETSWTRRVAVTLLTYLVVAAYFAAAGLQAPLVNAVVPSVAFVLASATLPWVERAWVAAVYDPTRHRPHGAPVASDEPSSDDETRSVAETE